MDIKISQTKMSARYRQREQAIRTQVLQAENESADAMKRTAQRLSSGSVPAAFLARERRRRGAGLYSTASPSPPNDPTIINAQSSRLKRSWRTYVAWKPDGTQITVWNTAPYAKYLAQGTHSAIMRPLMAELVRLERGPRLARLARARSLALKG